MGEHGEARGMQEHVSEPNLTESLNYRCEH